MAAPAAPMAAAGPIQFDLRPVEPDLERLTLRFSTLPSLVRTVTNSSCLSEATRPREVLRLDSKEELDPRLLTAEVAR